MLSLQPVQDNLYAFVGINRRQTRFENMFQLPKGVSFNSYLIDDQKVAILDGVDASVADAYYECIQKHLGDRQVDYIICNHVEPDHCSTLDGLLARYPQSKLIITKLGLKMLSQFYLHEYPQDRVILAEEGQTYDLGKHVLETITAPHVHWPEVTFTYEQTQHWLFSADAFGSFGTPSGHLFADKAKFEAEWLEEARRYYVNIVGRQGPHVLKALKKLEDKPISAIFPVHGLCFRTPDLIELMIDKYQHWASYTAEEPGVVLCYGSMYENSAQTADHLAFELGRLGVDNIRVYDVAETDISWIIADLFRFSHSVFLCNNYNTELFPKMDALLRDLILLNFSNHRYSLIGNGSWGGRGLPIAKEILEMGKQLEQVGPSVQFKSRPNPADHEKLQALAETIAGEIREQSEAQSA